MSNGISIKRGSPNLFADLGYADPKTHLLKAGLVTRIREILNDAKLNQTEAATRIGLGQPEVSRLLRGQFRDVSISDPKIWATSPASYARVMSSQIRSILEVPDPIA